MNSPLCFKKLGKVLAQITLRLKKLVKISTSTLVSDKAAPFFVWASWLSMGQVKWCLAPTDSCYDRSSLSGQCLGQAGQLSARLEEVLWGRPETVALSQCPFALHLRTHFWIVNPDGTYRVFTQCLWWDYQDKKAPTSLFVRACHQLIMQIIKFELLGNWLTSF